MLAALPAEVKISPSSMKITWGSADTLGYFPGASSQWAEPGRNLTRRMSVVVTRARVFCGKECVQAPGRFLVVVSGSEVVRSLKLGMCVRGVWAVEVISAGLGKK